MNTSMDILGVEYEFGPSVFYLFGPPDSVYRISSFYTFFRQLFSGQLFWETFFRQHLYFFLPKSCPKKVYQKSCPKKYKSEPKKV